uniref:ATP synthase F0 subunit 8 n=1 Tax=Rectidens sumatrensis TaxID=1903498 RepID=A0A8A3WFV5_9BIVA|nr:ATP synthase F0 subunit 8 [Rectidens sumatrensis]QTA71714.1 ATP synthase F0 subunit 8 [Rectidens sumatrensis]
MPQLSPMSWEIVFLVIVVCWVFFSVSFWWMVRGDYRVHSSVFCKLKKVKGNSFSWGFKDYKKVS